MKPITTLIFSIFLVSQALAQTGQAPNLYKDKVYVFDFYEQGLECDVLGNITSKTPVTLLKNTLFTVERLIDSTALVIRFLDWKDNAVNREKIELYNYEKTSVQQTITKTDGTTETKTTQQKEEKFFRIDRSAFDQSSSEYTKEQNWDITYGSLITPFKLRSAPFLFTTNLNLGAMVAFQRTYKSGFNWGITGGISLSSVQLDSLSTNGTVTSVSERPAFTPSVGIMLGYKKINLTISSGRDYINRISDVERSWIYHGKRWIGIGLGISLFKIDSGDSAPTKQP